MIFFYLIINLYVSVISVIFFFLNAYYCSLIMQLLVHLLSACNINFCRRCKYYFKNLQKNHRA